VIPALFPFMVLSELVVSGALGNVCFFLRPLYRILGLSDAGGCAYLLGLLCGAPVGARCLADAYKRGAIEKRECEYLLAPATVPSSAFLVSAVGTVLWDNARFGVLLLFSTLLSSILLTLFVFRTQKKAETCAPPFAPFLPQSSASLFASAIRSSAETMLTVTAYVVFFSVITGTAELLLTPLSVSATARASLSSLLELSDGMSRISSLGYTKPAALLSAFAAGWGGLSVHCQVQSVCDGSGLSLRPYFLFKVCMALISVLLMLLMLTVFPLRG